MTNKNNKLAITIDRWIADGADIKKFHVSGWIQRLRQIQMYSHALQVTFYSLYYRFLKLFSGYCL